MKARQEKMKEGEHFDLVRVKGQTNIYVIVPKDTKMSAFTTQQEAWECFYDLEMNGGS